MNEIKVEKNLITIIKPVGHKLNRQINHQLNQQKSVPKKSPIVSVQYTLLLC